MTAHTDAESQQLRLRADWERDSEYAPQCVECRMPVLHETQLVYGVCSMCEALMRASGEYPRC